MRKGGPDHTGPPSAKNLRGSAGPRRRHSYLGLPQQSLYTLPEPHGHLSFGCGINSSSCSSISHSPAIERDSQEKNDAQLDSVPRSGRMVAPHLPTEILAANLRVTYRKVGFSATTYMQKKPLARAIQQLERRISRDKDWVAEQSEFELPVPILEQPDDSWLFGSANEPLLLGLRKGLSSPRHCG
jgi:hypothetical protein